MLHATITSGMAHCANNALSPADLAPGLICPLLVSTEITLSGNRLKPNGEEASSTDRYRQSKGLVWDGIIGTGPVIGARAVFEANRVWRLRLIFFGNIFI